ncbi:hypothetical protein MY11210_007240 [Beauveria gryllotalpidicola]
MWANGSPAYLAGLSAVPTAPLLRDRPAKNVDKTGASRRGQASDSTGTRLDLADIYLPAVDGPPSSDTNSLRRLNAETRLATNLPPGQPHKVASSSSSTTSFTGILDQLDMMDRARARRSSFTSIESSHLSKDASEAFQQFSKNLFHRRGRSKQESTSSDSSLYSADGPVDSGSVLKDAVRPKLFARRKPSRDEPAALQKRLQISGPFNFQHVMHTNRDAAEDAMTQEGAANEVNSRPRATTGASEYTYTNILTETVAEHGHVADIPPPRPGLIARHTGNFQTMRRFIKSSKISDFPLPSAPTSAPTNRQPPQRPPRSPIEPEASSPPIPPPRISSRQTFYPASIDTASCYFAERPVKSAGFQRPQPFSPPSPVEQLPTPTRLAFTQLADSSALSQEGLLNLPRTATPEPAWPLASPTIASFETPLPDLMEDDGHTSWSSRAHTSRNSTNASLRGSRSVPMLAKLPEDQDAGATKKQPMETSAWSAQMKAELEESLGLSPPLGRASWEEDIDYCYEHEAEADCDYQWERPSMDFAPAGRVLAAAQSYSALEETLAKAPAQRYPGMPPSASGFEVPELSPASQSWAVLGHEAITPLSAHAAHAPLQLSHKCTELAVPLRLHDSREYQFSPSLLIPQDYQGEPPTACHGLQPSSLQRSSTATTASNYTSSTDSVGERHTSTNSSWTTFTRHTASTSSLNKLGMSWVDEAQPVPALAAASAPAETHEPADQKETSTMPPASEDVVPELVLAVPPPNRRTMHKSHASESILRNSVAPIDVQQLPKPRRPRARTSSLGQAPPIGQYALFPRSNIRTHGDKI